jgi:hypothetical protein
MIRKVMSVVASLAAALSAAAGDIPLQDTHHDDHRSAPRLVVRPDPDPAPAEAPVDAARRYLHNHADRFTLPPDLSNLKLTSVRESLLATHVRFQQYLGDVPIESAQIVVSPRRNGGAVYRIYNNTYPVPPSFAPPSPVVTPDHAVDIAWNRIRVHGDLISMPTTQLVYVPAGKDFRLVFKVQINTRAPFGYWEQRVDALTGDVLAIRNAVVEDSKSGVGREAGTLPDFAAYAGPVLSRAEAIARLAQRESPAQRLAANWADGSALVFDPDPKTTLMSDTLTDTSPASAFTPAYLTRTLRDITYAGGSYRLSGPWVYIDNFENPNTLPSTSVSGIWTATRGNNAFNDVMTYFHLDQNQRYIQSLGYTGTRGIQYGSIQADSDGLNGQDNSHFIPSMNALAFGHGGVDDNEDADVILHEYGHAIEDDINPDWGGGDTGAIGEGFGDYWAGSYSYSTSNGPSFHPNWVYTWDGHNSFWDGRMLDRTNAMYDPGTTYTAHKNMGTFISDELWSAPLFQSLVALMAMGRPRSEVDQIVLESHFGLGSGVRMPDMANATVLAAQSLFPEGPHAAVFFEKFSRQNILTKFPLPAPRVLYPAAGDVLLTGAVVNVFWDRRGAPPIARASVQYSAGASPPHFSDDVEHGVNGWTVSHASGSSDWMQITNASHSPTHGWFAKNDNKRSDQYLVSPAIVISNNNILSFWHTYDLESGYDGGVVEISTTGTGGPWVDIGTNSTQNGYDDTISTSYSSPIGGRPAFSGASGFIETVIALGAYAGSTVHIRFREADDSSRAATGWVVDDIRVGPAQTWTGIGTAASNASWISWTVAAAPGTGYTVRAMLTATNCADSAWDTGAAFTISADADGDGVPDAWEVRNFGSVTSVTAASDADNDGFSDLREYWAGTDPKNPGSRLEMTSISNAAGNVVRVGWTSVSNRCYLLERSTNLTAGFSALASNILSTSPANSLTDASATSAVFKAYRVRIP